MRGCRSLITGSRSQRKLAGLRIKNKTSFSWRCKTTSPQFPHARDTWNLGGRTTRGNTPNSGSVSLREIPAYARNPQIVSLSCSCGKYPFIMLYLPKYGLFRPRPMTTKGPRIEAIFNTLFTPSGTRKGRKNANMRVIFSDGGLKKGEVPENEDKKERFNRSLLFKNRSLRERRIPHAYFAGSASNFFLQPGAQK
jgi:hypothetical protein